MHTISDIITDVNRHCMIYNMVEESFLYRVVFFVNDKYGSGKHYIDTRYDGLRTALESIVRGNLTTTNTIMIAGVTVLKDGKCVSLLGREYKFSLQEYFHQIAGKCKKGNKKKNMTYMQAF